MRQRRLSEMSAAQHKINRQRRQGERLPTSKALAEVHRRIAAREAKQASQPLPVTAHEPARLRNLRRDCRVTHITEPPPLPELRGWQKILCGRLRSK